MYVHIIANHKWVVCHHGVYPDKIPAESQQLMPRFYDPDSFLTQPAMLRSVDANQGSSPDVWPMYGRGGDAH